MKRIVRVAVASAALLMGCSSPHLSIASATSGAATVAVGSTLVFQAIAQDTRGTVLWNLTGPGTLTVASGLQTVYVAPTTYDPAATTATLVASLSDAPSEKQTVTITIVKPSASIGGIAGLSATVSVNYDARDIPTISCVKTTDCYTVLGYIHARDRLFQMDFFRRAAQGTLSELVGEAALSQDQALRTFFTSRSGQPVAQALYAHVQSDPLVGPALAAYTSGVNAFINSVRTNASLLPAAYGQLVYKIDPKSTTDLPAWTDVDTVAVARLFQFQLSETAEQEADYGKWAQTWGTDPTDTLHLGVGLWIQAKSPIESFTLSGSGAPNAPTLVAQPGTLESLRAAGGAMNGAAQALGAIRQVRELMGAPAGSNNWVVDKAHTDIGQAFVANDPHLSLQYPSNFHLSHLVGVADGLNVMGPIFPGLPATLIGRGTHVGWGVTVVGYDVTDLYVEKLVPNPDGGLPLGTEFNGQKRTFVAVPQTYKFRTSAGLASASPSLVLVAPAHGPVISLDAATGSAITVRWTGQETETDDLRAFFRLNNAASVDDARQALEGDPKPDGGKYTGYYTGAQNFVLADDTGAIGYVPHACVPQRPWAASLAVYPYPVVPVDGRGTFEWATGPDGGLACVPDDKLPRAIGSNKGYLATANADPLGVSTDNNPYANNPNGVPYLSYEWDDQGYRIARIQEVLDAKTADGGKVSLADMQALQSDHVAIVARPFLTIIQDIGGPASTDPNVAAAANMLLGWGGADAGVPLDCPTGLVAGSLNPANAVNDPSATNTANSASCLLFHTFLRRVLETTFVDEEAVAGVGRSPGNEVRALVTLFSVPNPDNIFCRTVDAKGAPITNQNTSCADQVTNALRWAYSTLKTAYGPTSNWRWGRVHTLSFDFIVPGYPLIDPGFRPGPYPRPGGAWTVDVGAPAPSPSTNLGFPYRSGGNVRWVAAMDGTLAHTFMQLPGVESGNAYPGDGQPTMLNQWVQNQYFNFPFQKSDATSVRSESFSP